MFLDSVPLMNSEGSAVNLKLHLDVSYGTVMKAVKKKTKHSDTENYRTLLTGA